MKMRMMFDTIKHDVFDVSRGCEDNAHSLDK